MSRELDELSEKLKDDGMHIEINGQDYLTADEQERSLVFSRFEQVDDFLNDQDDCMETE